MSHTRASPTPQLPPTGLRIGVARDPIAIVRAAEHDRYGGPEQVQLREVQRPVPKDDEVLIRVQVASVNRGDLDGLRPKPQFVRLFMGLRAPRIKRIGLDAAGVVEAVGPAVSRFKVGDRVFADLLPFGAGAFAEFACAPEKAFLPIPDGLSTEDAATLPHSAVLALQGLRRRKGNTIQPGEKLLIDGASGNVGPFLVQIAKAMGAEVTGVASGDKLDFVRSLGADHVIDYRTTDYTRGNERYDWIVAVDSHHSIFRMSRPLRPNGTYHTMGGTGRSILGALILGPLIGRLTGKRMGLMLWWKPFLAADVATITRLIAEGKVRPAIDRRFPLAEVAEALRYVDDGHPLGKVLVTVESGS